MSLFDYSAPAELFLAKPTKGSVKAGLDKVADQLK